MTRTDLRRALRYPILLALALCLALPARADPPSEYGLKAAFLYKFARFVEWPDASFPQPATPVVIGVLGQDPFGAALERVAALKSVAGRRILLRRFRSGESAKARDCHILFISSSESATLPKVLTELKGAATLTVGDSPEFARAGGMIAFYIEDEMVRLMVNAAAARSAGLTISSELLTVSRIVK